MIKGVMAMDVIPGGAPLFRRIADALTDAVARGDYEVGGRLPTESTLMRMFGAGRFTIREALLDLRSRGLIATRRGSGTTVLRKTPQTPAFAETYRSIDTFLASVVEVPLQPTMIRDIIADEALAADLRCEPGRQLLMVRGVRKSRIRPEEPPLALADAYIAAVYSAIRPYLSDLKESIASTAERVLGVRVRSIVQELEPVLIDTESAKILAAEPGAPAMLVRRWYNLDGEVMLLTSRSIYPKGRLQFRTELRRSDSERTLFPASPPSADRRRNFEVVEPAAESG
jgi:DNA-binding GntR family transcriptional regulator